MAEPNCCREEINSLGEELNSLITKSKELKSEYRDLLVENLKKDLLIRELKNKCEQKNQKYTNFKNVISTAALNEIKSIGDSQNDDNSFVEVILKDWYGVELKHKTLSGRSFVNKEADQKSSSEIREKSKNILMQLFNERIQNDSLDTIDARRRTLWKCIRNAIDKAKRQN